jgi:uncharacterized protein
MTLANELFLIVGGIITGILAGLLGSGGGFLCVPLLLTLNYTPIQAIGTSTLAVSIISISGSIQNSRMGYFSLIPVLAMGLPTLLTTQVGVHIISSIKPYLLLTLFGATLLLLIYLTDLRKKIVASKKDSVPQAFNLALSEPGSVPSSYASAHAPARKTNLTLSRLMTGSLAGLYAGFSGGGAGVVLVPLQILILGESLKAAIQNSVGVNIIISTSSWLGHASLGNVLFTEGILLGIGGSLGAIVGTRTLPKLSDKTISLAFRSLVIYLSLYMFWKAWRSYQGL